VVAEAIPAYIELLRKSLSADPHETAYVEARARRMRAAAEAAELELQVKKGTLYRQDDLEFGLGLMLRNTGNRLLAVPSKVMHALVGRTNATGTNEIVRVAIEGGSHSSEQF